MRTKAAVVQDAAAARLDGLFRARSVALVGATERSIWSQAAFANFARIGFAGRVHPVSRKGGVVHGSPAATSCAAIGEHTARNTAVITSHFSRIATISLSGSGNARGNITARLQRISAYSARAVRGCGARGRVMH